MIRLLSRCLVLLLASFIIHYSLFIIIASPAFAQTIDLLQYFFPSGNPANHISSGEIFQTVPDGNNGFIIYKSTDPSYYERFRFNENFIYHLEDTTWATEQGNVKCWGTNNDAYFIPFAGNFGAKGSTCPFYNSTRLPMEWISRYMQVGECATFEGTTIGFDKQTGECCETNFSGPGGGHTICLTFQGCINFPTGVASKDTIVLTIQAGAGAGENFYYDKERGWIGFDRGKPNTGAYITDSLPSPSPGEECLEVEPTYPSCPTPATDETDSRPNMCDPCTSDAPTYPFCATTPTVSQTFSFPASAGSELSFTLGGAFSLNSSGLKIPFVGKEGEEQEMKYIADYFEGYSKNLRSGVFRKLAPQTVQDDLKREMISRASGFAPNPVHDYLVTNYEGENARLTEFLNNMKPENRAKQTAWERKNGGKWYRLWPYVPMFTREDSPGQVTLAVEPPGTMSNPGPFEIQVPHVARLYEITKVLSQLLMPNLSEESLSGKSLNSLNSLNTQTTSRFPASLNPSLASSNNLLTNPNFEKGFSERGAGEITVANGWDPWYRAPEGPGEYHRPEYKPEDGESFTDPLRVCSGRFAQKFFTTYSTHEAGFYQQASVPSGSQVTFSIWGLAWSSAQNDPKSCAETGNYRLSVGIDPTGGADPYSANIVWSNPSFACNIPVLLSVSAAAQGPTVTVFTKGAPEWPVKHNDSYWDNACLVVGTTLPTECFACDAAEGGGIAECEYPEAATGDGDPICVGGKTGRTISTRITATDTIHHEPEISDETKTHAVSRKIGITFHHPYLKEIWQQTTETAEGLFNIFRLSNPELAPPPNDETPAYGKVGYSFSGGDINKTEGKVYFPFLEGIRRIKEWVAGEALAPSVSESN